MKYKYLQKKRINRNKIEEISEARLNELTYILLKLCYLGEKIRGYDVKTCMEIATGTPTSPLINPDILAPKSHDITYKVSPQMVLDACEKYAYENFNLRIDKTNKHVNKVIDISVRVVMTAPEDRLCVK